MYQPTTAPRPLAPAGVTAAPETPAIPLPPEPQSVEQTGLTVGFLADLALKTLYQRGQMTLGEISLSLGLPINGVIDRVMEFLKAEHLVEIRGGAGISSASYQFVIVEKGSEKAQEALARSQYIGKAPVPLATYIAAVQRQSITNLHVTPEELVRAFAHLVVPRELLAQLGPAVNSGKSIFLFGPPGNGKTTIAEVLVSLLKGEVVLPYAIEIDQQVIKVYDQVYHRAVLEPGQAERLRYDHRWVISKRPIVMTGGELTLETLDLVDEAFLRRIRYKIGIEAPSVAQYEEIFKRMCVRKNVEYRAEAMSQILAIYRKRNLELRSCHPRDIIESLTDTARFLGQPPALTPQLIEMACDSYFVTLDPTGAPKES